MLGMGHFLFTIASALRPIRAKCDNSLMKNLRVQASWLQGAWRSVGQFLFLKWANFSSADAYTYRHFAFCLQGRRINELR
jgi:hypothetical protein